MVGKPRRQHAVQCCEQSACLNHISGAKAGVAGVYNRAAYANEKKVALERWAAHLSGLLKGRPANVTPIRKGRA